MHTARPVITRLLFASCALFFLGQTTAAEDRIVSLSVQEQLGFEEVPVVRVEVEIDTKRDLHVSFQTWGDWKAVKRTMRRIPQSGKYHFEVPFDTLKPGKYRIAAYLTPRRKDWNDRVGNTMHAPMEVVDQPTFAGEAAAFSAEDKIQQIDWPKEVSGSQEVTLEIRYQISAPRDLVVRLANSDNWKQMGELVFPVKEPGVTSLPLVNLTADFPPGNYAWIVFLAEPGTKEPQLGKLGKHFVLTE